MIPTTLLRKAMDDIARNRGEFSLFALLLRTNALGKSDLVVSAPWLVGGTFKATSEFVELLIGSIGRQALPQFGRVLALEKKHPLVAFIIKTFPVADGELRVRSSEFLEFNVEEALILRAKPVSKRKAPKKALHPVAGGSSRGRR